MRSTAKLIFWDTGGFYSLLSNDDKAHEKTKKILTSHSREQVLAVTSDWIIGEICNLLVVRKKGYLADRFLRYIEDTKFLKIYHISDEVFERSRVYFKKHLDQGFSFTDCTSFILMHDLKIKDAMTGDSHFAKAGFRSLL